MQTLLTRWAITACLPTHLMTMARPRTDITMAEVPDRLFNARPQHGAQRRALLSEATARLVEVIHTLVVIIKTFMVDGKCPPRGSFHSSAFHISVTLCAKNASAKRSDARHSIPLSRANPRNVSASNHCFERWLPKCEINRSILRWSILNDKGIYRLGWPMSPSHFGISY